jgi:hypothetical protein
MNMVYYKAPPRHFPQPWVLLLAGVLLGMTLSSLLHLNPWQTEHCSGIAGMHSTRDSFTNGDGEQLCKWVLPLQLAVRSL